MSSRQQDDKPCANIALLTAGRDKPYALGLAEALREKGIPFEFLGSDDVDAPYLHTSPLVTFFNLRGDQSIQAPLHTKITRVLRYYRKLLTYALVARPRVFHVLWNNKFEWFDRTILLLFYRLCGRRIVFTAHNVNIGQRDGTDSFMNRFTLRMQYSLVDDIFVHTERMKEEIQNGFRIPSAKIHVIPFPMNSTVPNTALNCAQARMQLGINPQDRVLLAFGAIAPYKGLEFIVDALAELRQKDDRYRLLIAGAPKNGEVEYWESIRRRISDRRLDSAVVLKIEHIPDEQTEIYFKAADALVLSYTYIFQSGVLFLGYNFGLPALAADVGSFRESVVDSETGFMFRSRDAGDLACVIERFFSSEIYREMPARRDQIRAFASQNYSWSKAACSLTQVYSRLLGSDLRAVL